MQIFEKRPARTLFLLLVWAIANGLACAPEVETTRIGDYNDDGKIVIACLGDSNTCFGGAGECGHQVEPWCHQLRDLMPKTMGYRGREREIVILNFGWNGARAERSDVRDFRHKPNDRFRLAAQVAWATDLAARDREPKLRDYPRITSDVIIMAFGTNDYKALKEEWWPSPGKPAWWPSPLAETKYYPRRPEEVSAALFRVMDGTHPDAPSRGVLPLRAYVALIPPTQDSPERSHWEALANQTIRADFAKRSLPPELLIDFSTGFENPDFYGFKSYYGKRDQFHINTKGQAQRAEVVREALCGESNRECTSFENHDPASVE